jgi:hypothetical protein
VSTPEDAHVTSEAGSYWRTDDRFSPAQCELLERVFINYPQFEQPLELTERARLAGIVAVLSTEYSRLGTGEFDRTQLCFWYPIQLPRIITRKMMRGEEKSPPRNYRPGLDEGRTRKFLEQVQAFNDTLSSGAVTALTTGEKVKGNAPTHSPRIDTGNQSVRAVANKRKPKPKNWWATEPPGDGWHGEPLIGMKQELARWVGVALRGTPLDEATLATMHTKSIWIWRVDRTTWRAYFRDAKIFADANAESLKPQTGTQTGAKRTKTEPTGSLRKKSPRK